MQYLQKLLYIIKGWRTFIFNTAVLVAGLAQYADIINIIAPEYYPLLLMFVNIANIVLRYLTDTAVFKKQSAS